MTERRIEQIHLQITKNCNLKCYFCGQWGKKGFFSDATGKEMSLLDWERVIQEIVNYRKKTGISPFIMIWGGEPLVSPYFAPLVEKLHKNQFEIGIVTNGVLIDRHKALMEEKIQRIFVSVDGTAKVHDAIRGQGIFEKVISNLKGLSKPEVVVMSVITQSLLEELLEFLTLLNDIPIKELYLQDVIGLSRGEIADYQIMMKEVFGISADYIHSWENNDRFLFHEEVGHILKSIDKSNYHYTICHKVHGEKKKVHCLSPFRHVHVTWNGDVTYCTDFYDFKAGNVREQSLEDIFYSVKSERFREIVSKGQCVTCNHCSWRNNERYLY